MGSSMDSSMSEYIVIVVVIILTFVIGTMWLKARGRKKRK